VADFICKLCGTLFADCDGTDVYRADQPLQIHTLGRFGVWRDGNPLRFASRGGVPRQQLMLALVLTGGTRGVSRTLILDSLWPHTEGDLAERSFRTTLYRLRQILGLDAFQKTGASLCLNAEAVWVDSAAFEALAGSLIRAIQVQAGAEPRVIEQALIALRLYEGDFLPDYDTPPITARRESLRRLFHDLVVRVAEHQIAADAVPSALDIYRQGLDRSQPSEQLFQGLLRCHLAMGQFTEGLAAFARCRAFLLEHFNAQPAAETERLKRALHRAARTSRAPPP